MLDQTQPDVTLVQNLAAGAFTFWEEALDVSIHDACRRNLGPVAARSSTLLRRVS